MYYSARYYDAVLGRFISADTIVPNAGNSQNLNRYSYVENNPVKYVDPSGHDEDILGIVNDFAVGFVGESIRNNFWFLPQAQEALEVQSGESVAMTVGRTAADFAIIFQGVSEIGSGGAAMGGGAIGCGTGVLCLAGAPAIAAGAGIAVHGAGTGIAGAIHGGENLGRLYAMGSAAEDGSAGQRIAGTEGLEHSFDRHAPQWFGRPVSKSKDFTTWQKIIERAAQSKERFNWSVGSFKTVAHLARVDGNWFVVQFYAEGEHAGELATAFVPNQDELEGMLKVLGK